ncbi:VgrG-related protein [Paraburkholderia dipogonis]|uniref:VgrG-related protein n=1 Tax=Paraburkholderia dipogonis TaxID=1211383 RepID=UPI0038B7A878
MQFPSSDRLTNEEFEARRARAARPSSADEIRRQNAAMSQARPAPLDVDENGSTAAPTRRRSPTQEQREGDRAADRQARADERAAATAKRAAERAEAKQAREFVAQERHNERIEAQIAKEKQKEAAKPGLATHTFNAVSGAPEIDPTIAAVHEVQAAIAPVGRGLSHIFGRPGGKDAWYKRIWNELRGSRKDQSTFHKAEQKTLQQIDDKTGGSSAGIFGMLGSLLSKIPGLGFLGRLAGGGMVGRLLGAGARGAGGLAGLALRGGKGFFRRIPLLGALFAGGSAAASIAGFGDDPNASPEENRLKRFSGTGSGIGALVGGGIGTLLGGPVGSVIGGMIGDKVGELVGKWLSTLDWAKIGATITDTWDGAVKDFSAIWDTVSKWFQDKFGIVTGLANNANDYVKAKTGIDVKATTAEVAKAVTIAARDSTEVAKKAAVAATGYVADRATKMAAPLVGAGKAAKDWVLGKTSQFFESGNRGAAAISSGTGDHGGASYGMYQLASAGGAKSTLSKFLTASGYASQFAGLTPGSPEFNAKWKQIAASDPAFGTAQHDFIKSTHFDPQMTLLGKAGIDLSKRGAAVQDAVWSTSVQFGGQTSLIKSALAGKDPSQMSDAEIVSAIQNYKIAHNSDLFKNSSAATRASTLNRAGAERSRLLALAAPLPSPAMTPGINVPAVADAAPSVPTSLGKAAPVEVRISKDAGDVGPTVSDPKIARLVSGGLSGN